MRQPLTLVSSFHWWFYVRPAGLAPLATCLIMAHAGKRLKNRVSFQLIAAKYSMFSWRFGVAAHECRQYQWPPFGLQ